MARREVNLGVTAPVPKGEWNSTAKYQVLNIVTKGTASYMAISPNMGIEPETHSSWTSYWQLLSKGLRGATGAKLVSQEYIGQDENGGNIYKQTYDDGTVAYFTAPRGLKGENGESAGLPEVGKEDNGKFLYVKNGSWQVVDLSEEWVFTLEDGTTVTKKVVVLSD